MPYIASLGKNIEFLSYTHAMEKQVNKPLFS